MTATKKNVGKFGWCLTEHHENCILVLPSFPDLRCECECHDVTTAEPPITA